MHNWWNMGMGMFWWLWLPLIILLVWFIIRTTNKNKTNQAGGGTQESALDILKKRYAKGEISKEEYEEKKKEL